MSCRGAEVLRVLVCVCGLTRITPALAATAEGGTGAHARHAAASIGCAVCHPCGGSLEIAPDVVYPRGTSTSGAQVTAASPTAPATCQVGCHSPLGAPVHEVTWTAGVLQCTACHAQLAAAGTASAHVDAGAASASCVACHDQSQHTRGAVRLVGGDASDAACVGCHSGRGQTLGDRTPPLLVGWSDPVAGDFHGARVGACRFDGLDSTGAIVSRRSGLACPPAQPAAPLSLRLTPRWWYASGLSGPWAWTCQIETLDETGTQVAPVLTGQPCPDGTLLDPSCNNPALPGCRPTTVVTRGAGGALRAPDARAQGAMPCSACHDAHASANAFLLAASVNGVAVPGAAIDRAGVGAQALCNACHLGERHLVCMSCHRERLVSDGTYTWYEGAPADPAPDGSPCFFCHGHEGIVRMTLPTPAYPPSHPQGGGAGPDACSHCHGGWAPPPTERVAPVVVGASVTGVTATTANVAWRTGEIATTYVEYGVGTAGYVAGDGALVTEHALTLTNLAPATTYVWRVRSADRFRNVTESAIATFTTPGAEDVPRPDLGTVDAAFDYGTSAADVQLVWYPVTAPSGTAVEYEVQLASDPGFTYLVNGALAGPGVPGSSVADSGWVAGTSVTSGGRAALGYGASLTNIPQNFCDVPVPAVYYWRVRARDEGGRVSEWSAPGRIEAVANESIC